MTKLNYVAERTLEAGAYRNVLKSIGNTPLVKLRHLSKSLHTNIYAKLECFNPGLSAKDRIAAYMIEQAERNGQLEPGGTVIDATSGNTGLALAMICGIKGYRCVLTVADKASKEKVNALKAMGAEVILCPSKVKPEDPRSYYSQAIRLAKEISGACYTDQNFNPNNNLAHYHSTGPEIWEQTEGRITHLVAAVGTGGTMCGTAQFLKEQNPNIETVGVDAHGSVLKKYHETGIFDDSEIHPYKMEGVGKSIIPGNVKFDVIDYFIKVNDKDSAHMVRSCARREGLFLGYSSGAAMQAVQQKKDWKEDDVVVIVCSDHGSKYLSSVYNDDWMKEQGFI
ncbi:MAG: cysteine synthase family protein [Bacteroidota bacterium]